MDQLSSPGTRPPSSKNVGANVLLVHSSVKPAVENDIDWFSVEDVAVSVDKAVLEGMQRLWKQHALRMDAEGKEFAENMLNTHRDAVQSIASIKSFDLASVLAELNRYTSEIRDRMSELYKTLKAADDDFAVAMYGAVRATFSTNLRTAIETRDAWYHDRMKGLRERFEASLAAARASVGAEVAAALKQQRQQIEKEAAEKAAAEIAKGQSISTERGVYMSEKVEAEMLEMRKQIKQLQEQLAETERERNAWQTKWAEERARGDSIRRECLAIIQRSEEHVSKLQHQHVAELSQRDYLLRRCKDTITNMESKLGITESEPIEGL